jgi:ElaB/YqjD/DUF883 family membrane-anchored ribosome-binding protein
MSNQDFGREAATRAPESKAKLIKDAATEAINRASGVAREAGSKAKEAASDTATSMTDHVKELLDKQIGSGATMGGHFANSIKLAADDLGKHSPALAGFVHQFADKVEVYADDMQDQTVEQLVRTASDYTRRQPALVFGLAAVAGFFLFRTARSASAPTSAPPIQPAQAWDQEQDHG